MSELKELHVQVKFGAGVPTPLRGEALLDFERMLRKLTGQRIEVFQEKRGDDSRLRAAMTEQQRAKL